MNQLAVAIAIVLFPGFLASVICDKIVVHAQRWDAFKYAIYSFLFGLLSYTLLQLLAYSTDALGYKLIGVQVDKNLSISAWKIISEEKYKINLSDVAWATLLSPVIAAAAATTVNRKYLNRVAERLGISNKYGDENLYSFFLNAETTDWVYVQDKDAGLIYFGQVFSFAEYSGVQELVLSSVQVHDYETAVLLYGVSSIYLTKPTGKFVIEVP